jgi:hypothetical protein
MSKIFFDIIIQYFLKFKIYQCLKYTHICKYTWYVKVDSLLTEEHYKCGTYLLN